MLYVLVGVLVALIMFEMGFVTQKITWGLTVYAIVLPIFFMWLGSFFSFTTVADFVIPVFWYFIISLLGLIIGWLVSRFGFKAKRLFGFNMDNSFTVVHVVGFLLKILTVFIFFAVAYPSNYVAAFFVLAIIYLVQWYANDYLFRKNYAHMEKDTKNGKMTVREMNYQITENYTIRHLYHTRHGFHNATEIKWIYLYFVLATLVLFLVNISKMWYPSDIQDVYINIVGLVLLGVLSILVPWLYPLYCEKTNNLAEAMDSEEMDSLMETNQKN